MRVVIQRVSRASVSIDEEIKASIGPGLLVLAGIEGSDDTADVAWLARKIVQLRVFDDDDGVMNKSLMDTGGALLVISQFTLHAKTKKGNRPSYINAAAPETAIPLYRAFIEELYQCSGIRPETGVFGADMQVELVNDGPVTIIMDSKNKE